eukprot:TRINITY_DN11967_c0_g1_i2.p2 TRINITY_DN11967_c0_g1~~TRINITY_DN11967_c0_g1_i2.p2  ORF type:complete len:102 (+),score=11.98 TRINITY_DN11967_c0_g1_i2:110-415(+)
MAEMKRDRAIRTPFCVSAPSTTAQPTKGLCSLRFPSAWLRNGYEHLKQSAGSCQQLEIISCTHLILSLEQVLLACQGGYRITSRPAAPLHIKRNKFFASPA